MGTLEVCLFGQVQVQSAGLAVPGLESAKVQELLCYLLLHRDQPHPRELLASILWGDTSTSHSRAYLRKALWQLQLALRSSTGCPSDDCLVVTPGSVALHSDPGLWLDAALFEQAFEQAQGRAGRELNPPQIAALQSAVGLYRAELLKGWYQEWCLQERDRFEHMYLSMLDKLMDYCEVHQEYQAGITYGGQILNLDRAHEHTHRRLMRLYFLSGDRTAALRQYERCVAALEKELGVRPARRTVALYDQLCMDQVARPGPESSALASEEPPPPAAVLGRLMRLCSTLSELHRQLQQDIETLSASLSRQL